MKITFNILYKTSWGEKLFIVGSHEKLGNWNEHNGLQMNIGHGDRWTAEVEISDSAAPLEYKYVVKNTYTDTIIWEGMANREVQLDLGRENIILWDNWRHYKGVQNAFFKSAFTNVVFKRNQQDPPLKAPKQLKTKTSLRLRLNAARINPDYHFCVVGSSKELGNWDVSKALVLNNAKYPVWEVDLQVTAGESIEYKYGVYDKTAKRFLHWDAGSNRKIDFQIPAKVSDDLIVVTDDFFQYEGNWKGTGVAIPVFSLRSRQGTGVGEFSDLKLLVDWAKETGMKLVQILPINDTVATHKWTDSYPYAAISVFALHPIYINLQKMGQLKDRTLQQEYKKIRQELNELELIDYEAVMKAKSRFFKQLFDQEKDNFLADKGFKAYFRKNVNWLRPYAAFSYLRDKFGTPVFEEWPEYAVFDDATIKELCDPSAPHFEHIAVHYFIQYHAHLQLEEAANYARKNGIILKGDIPIGIYRNSMDAWVAPHLYNMKSQAGAPPDDYAVSGQNWRFPTYNWHEMAKDDFAWWKERLTQMSDYFDAFRIDHILGFFRIWEIDWNHVEGIMGHFNPSIPLTRDELSSKGLPMRDERYAQPYIREHFLYSRFGQYTDEVKYFYLDVNGYESFRMKPDFDTQRKVENHFKGKEDEKSIAIRNGLYSLLNEVLFLEAPFSNGQAFNPRIAVHQTQSYRDLSAYEKQKLNAIYDDYFYHRHNDFWASSAMSKLPTIVNATDMLICGEDLGMIPDCVPGVMEEVDLLSLEIQRMPKGNASFGHPSDYPYMSVASPSCHDMSTVRGWWEENPDKAQTFYNEILGNWGAAPFFCEPDICRQVVVQHLFSTSMWSIFPIQDLVAMDGRIRWDNTQLEQINEPSNPNHYWRYRFHIPLEDLLKEEAFNKGLHQLVWESGRLAF